jgi:single-strand DNA-binding protein
MFETYVTVIGRIVTTPEKRRTVDGNSVVTFRMASNERRFRDGEWGDGDSLYLGVTCWRSAADNVHTSLLRGDAVVVRGRLRTREFVDKEGSRRSVVDMEALAIGPDLFHSTARVMRAPRSDLAVAVPDPWAGAVPGGSDAGEGAGASPHAPGLDQVGPDGAGAVHGAPAPSASIAPVNEPVPDAAPVGSPRTGRAQIGSASAAPAGGGRPGAGPADDPQVDGELSTPVGDVGAHVREVVGEAVEGAFGIPDLGPVERTATRRRTRTAAPARARAHDGAREDDPTEAGVRV